MQSQLHPQPHPVPIPVVPPALHEPSHTHGIEAPDRETLPHIYLHRRSTPETLSGHDERRLDAYIVACEQREERFTIERRTEREQRKQQRRLKELRTRSEDENDRVVREDGNLNEVDGE